ncbi:MAG: Jag N-terminal domain-containing protein [Desulfobulbaceae bacterium]|nr:Jag N-terminal domain-containing protein [Desulfobulbaceae bacterium]
MPTKHKEYKGNTLDDAIAAACSDLKCNQEDLHLEVLSAGSAGIFGFCKKKAVITASRKEHSHCRPENKPQAEGRPTEKPRHHSKANSDRSRSKSAPKHSTSSSPVESTKSLPPSTEVLDQIKELLATLLRLMDFTAEISITASGDKVTAHISTEGDADRIIGRDGSTLDAIQYLLRKIVSQKFSEKINLDLDAGNYREDRQKELESLALELADKVRETGKSQIISALNPAERRIVHIALQDDTTIRSSSIGDGLFKKIRIALPGQGRKRSSHHGRGRSSAMDPSAS